MPRCDISVVMPVLNGADHIAEQLGALQGQDPGVLWEVVVSDNGSTDDTVRIVRQFQKDFPVRLVLVDSSAAPGAGQARNLGVLVSCGDLIAFCDADDIVGAGWVRAAYEALQSADFVGGVSVELRDPLDPDAAALTRGGLNVNWTADILTNNAAVRRSTFLAVGGFEGALPPYGMEDLELGRRIVRSGSVVGHAPAMVVHFRRTTEFKQVMRKVFQSAQAEYVVFRLHPDRFDAGSSPAGLLRLLVGAWWGLLLADRDHRRSAMRQVVRRLGHLAGYLRWYSGGRTRGSMLLEGCGSRNSRPG